MMILGNASSCYVHSLVHFLLASVLYLKPSLFFLCLISAANLWVVITLTLCLWLWRSWGEVHNSISKMLSDVVLSAFVLFFSVINCHISGSNFFLCFLTSMLWIGVVHHGHFHSKLSFMQQDLENVIGCMMSNDMSNSEVSSSWVLTNFVRNGVRHTQYFVELEVY